MEIPAVDSLGYCQHCREAIIVAETSRGRVWVHRNAGIILCERMASQPAKFAEPSSAAFGADSLKGVFHKLGIDHARFSDAPMDYPNFLTVHHAIYDARGVTETYPAYVDFRTYRDGFNGFPK